MTEQLLAQQLESPSGTGRVVQKPATYRRHHHHWWTRSLATTVSLGNLWVSSANEQGRDPCGGPSCFSPNGSDRHAAGATGYVGHGAAASSNAARRRSIDSWPETRRELHADRYAVGVGAGRDVHRRLTGEVEDSARCRVAPPRAIVSGRVVSSQPVRAPRSAGLAATRTS